MSKNKYFAHLEKNAPLRFKSETPATSSTGVVTSKSEHRGQIYKPTPLELGKNKKAALRLPRGFMRLRVLRENLRVGMGRAHKTISPHQKTKMEVK